ncbi:Permease of the drug/metabolite transporter (DMT) superfamily [Hyphomicrobiales bacterium]|nr:Permease of the drug/metabolite transporter (DMT) superfamily [Hyphomicrobiales bacterium]CAH1700306.1 Permease of the drug/metabolite transporter (DMT) superfamily [Hyphomicrobiales bacterium]CAI0344187.1 EamA family transporter [Hyphomicrobiales bacterium]
MSTQALDDPAAAPNRATEIALLLGLATLWGGSYTFIKIGVETIPPLTLIAARTLIAGLILLAVIRWRGLRLPREAETWRRFLTQACLNSVVPFTLIAWAERSIDAGLASILNGTTPVFVFLISLALMPGKRPDWRKGLGVTAGMAGISLIVGVDAFTGLGHTVLPQLAIVAATVAYACAALFGRHFTGMDPLLPAAGSMLAGTALLIPAALVVDRPWTLDPSAESLLALLALSIFSTALAFAIYFRLIRTLGSVGTTAVSYLRVPIGVAIGLAFLGESLSSTAWAGLGFVVLGVMAMTLPERRSVEAR